MMMRFWWWIQIIKSTVLQWKQIALQHCRLRVQQIGKQQVLIGCSGRPLRVYLRKHIMCFIMRTHLFHVMLAWLQLNLNNAVSDRQNHSFTSRYLSTSSSTSNTEKYFFYKNSNLSVFSSILLCIDFISLCLLTGSFSFWWASLAGSQIWIIKVFLLAEVFCFGSDGGRPVFDFLYNYDFDLENQYSTPQKWATTWDTLCHKNYS